MQFFINYMQFAHNRMCLCVTFSFDNPTFPILQCRSQYTNLHEVLLIFFSSKSKNMDLWFEQCDVQSRYNFNLNLKPILYYLLTPAHPLTGPICHVVDHSSLEWSCLEQTRLPQTYTRPRRAVEQANTPIIELSRVLIVWIKKSAVRSSGAQTSNRMTKTKRMAKTNQNWEVRVQSSLLLQSLQLKTQRIYCTHLVWFLFRLNKSCWWFFVIFTCTV